MTVKSLEEALQEKLGDTRQAFDSSGSKRAGGISAGFERALEMVGNADPEDDEIYHELFAALGEARSAARAAAGGDTAEHNEGVAEALHDAWLLAAKHIPYRDKPKEYGRNPLVSMLNGLTTRQAQARVLALVMSGAEGPYDIRVLHHLTTIQGMLHNSEHGSPTPGNTWVFHNTLLNVALEFVCVDTEHGPGWRLERARPLGQPN